MIATGIMCEMMFSSIPLQNFHFHFDWSPLCHCHRPCNSWCQNPACCCTQDGSYCTKLLEMSTLILGQQLGARVQEDITQVNYYNHKESNSWQCKSEVDTATRTKESCFNPAFGIFGSNDIPIGDNVIYHFQQWYLWWGDWKHHYRRVSPKWWLCPGAYIGIRTSTINDAIVDLCKDSTLKIIQERTIYWSEKFF